MAERDRLTPYSEMADLLDSLPLILREARRAHGLTMREAAEQIGVATSTVCRMEAGEGFHVDNAIAAMRWLDKRTDGA